jgi:hypothetical protein
VGAAFDAVFSTFLSKFIRFLCSHITTILKFVRH